MMFKIRILCSLRIQKLNNAIVQTHFLKIIIFEFQEWVEQKPLFQLQNLEKSEKLNSTRVREWNKNLLSVWKSGKSENWSELKNWTIRSFKLIFLKLFSNSTLTSSQEWVEQKPLVSFKKWKKVKIDCSHPMSYIDTTCMCALYISASLFLSLSYILWFRF